MIFVPFFLHCWESLVILRNLFFLPPPPLKSNLPSEPSDTVTVWNKWAEMLVWKRVSVRTFNRDRNSSYMTDCCIISSCCGEPAEREWIPTTRITSKT